MPARHLRLLVVLLCVAFAAATPVALADDAADQSYQSAAGLLNRGMNELAAQEYEAFLKANPDHAKASDARYGLAVCYYRLSRRDDAVTQLEKLAKLDGFEYGAEVLAMLGQCRLAAGDNKAAAEAFGRLIEKYPKHDLVDDAAALRVEALYLDNQSEQAATQAHRFTREFTDNPLRERVLFYWGSALMVQSQWPEAAKRFAELVRDFPAGPFAAEAQFSLAQCYDQAGETDKAVDAYTRVVKQPEGQHTPEALLALATIAQAANQPKQAGTLLDTLLERFADHALAPRARLLRGRAWFDQGEYSRAAELFDSLAQDGEFTAQRAYWLAKCKLRQEQYADVAGELAKAIERFPESDLLPEMRYDRAVALVRAEQYEAAVDALDAFRKQHPNHAMVADAQQLLAHAEHRLGRYEQSAEHCTEFLKNYPDHSAAAAIAFLAAENDFLMERSKPALRKYESFVERFGDDPLLPKAQFRRAMALVRLDQPDDARPLLLEAAKHTAKDEAYRVSLFALGEIDFGRGEWKQAQQWYERYLDGDLTRPNAADALLKLGLAHQRQQQYAEAISAYDQLLAQFPDGPQRLQAVFERGQALVALERFDEAGKAFETVFAEGKDSRFAPYALNHLGAIAARRGDNEAAARYFEQAGSEGVDKDVAAAAQLQRGESLLAAGKYADAEKVLRAFVTEHANHKEAPQAKARIALAISRQDRYADAIKAIDQFGDEGIASLDPSMCASLRYEKAWCLRKLGRNDEATTAYRTLLDAQPEAKQDPHALLDLAELEVEAGHCEAATPLLERICTRASDESVADDVLNAAMYRLGVCRFQEKDFKAAAAMLEDLLGRHSDQDFMVSAAYFCGESLLALGKHKQAAERFSQIVEQHPDDAAFGPSLLRLGECAAALQLWERSERAFDEFLRKFESDGHAYQARFGLGWARENQGRYPEAMEAYRAVAANHKGPTAARAQFQIGECLFAQKQYDDAVRELLKVDILYAYPEWSAAALYEAGRCFEQLGKSVEAREQFKAVRDKYGGTHWAELSAQRLAAVSDGALPRGGSD